MVNEKFKDLIEKLRVQHLPNGDVELLETDRLPTGTFLQTSMNISRVTIERDEDMIFISKLTPKIFLQLKTKKASYNIGILKNLAIKMSNEMRSNAIFTT